MDLSICIITKNESEKLKRCLESIQGLGAEIVVVDTGSSDDTQEVINKYAHKSGGFTWCDDFAAAKNYAIGLASHDTILFLDSDEWLTEDTKVETLWGQLCQLDENSIGRVIISSIVIDDKGSHKNDEYISRIFNRKHFKYQGRIHEQLVPFDSRVKPKYCNTDIVFDHDGYCSENTNLDEKFERNKRLLELTVEENPNSCYFLFQLGKTYYLHKEYDKAEIYFGKAIANIPVENYEYVENLVVSYGYSLIRQEKFSQSLILDKWKARYQNSADFMFVLGLSYMNNLRLDDALTCFKICVNQEQCAEEGVNSYLAFHNIASIYELQKNYIQARKYFNLEIDARVGQREKIKIAFMPYNANMWDSMESVYQAAMDDERCQVDIIPLPYATYSKEEDIWSRKCDIDDFRKLDLAVTAYSDYDLSIELPDIIYIHNPYDKYNNVTRIDDKYFSSDLRRFTKCLVYIPYYVNAKGVSKIHAQMPSLVNMDYIICQNQNYAEGLKTLAGEDKCLVLGSPKLDHIIQVSQNQGLCPEEWKSKLKNKKVILLATTVRMILKYGLNYLNRLEDILDFLCNQEEIALIWRPHPLEEETIKSNCPEYLERYQTIFEKYSDKDNIIMDYNPDAALAISLSHALISCQSSIINLYGITGKPVFIYDCSVSSEISQEEGMSVRLKEIQMTESGWKFSLVGQKQVFEADGDDFENITLSDDALNQVFYNELQDEDLVKLGEIFKDHAEKNGQSSSGKPIFASAVMLKDKLYMSAEYSSEILCFDINTAKINYINMSADNLRFGLMASDGNYLYISEVISGSIIKFSPDKGIDKIIEMPASFKNYKGASNIYRPFSWMGFVGDKLIALPHYSNVAIKIDVRDDQVQILAEDFWQDQDTCIYKSSMVATTSKPCIIDENTILVERKSDCSLGLININDNSYETCPVKFNKETYEKVFNMDLGLSSYSGQRIRYQESLNNTLGKFLGYLLENQYDEGQEVRAESYSQIAVNLDGSAGEKIHKTICDRVK